SATTPPFTTFNFAVEITDEQTGDAITSAAFCECDGLEVNLEPKTLREGGRVGPTHLAGPVSYGQLTLKRGMTAGFELWNWFARVSGGEERGLRAEVAVIMLDSGMGTSSASGAGQSAERPERARFVLSGCLPVKVRGPALNAKDGLVAIEEVQIVFEKLTLTPPSGS
ncbi:MAG: phage tail protein, partial [Polyangiaceae bacterium]|nr:phage tail protein [Polyangiaceae bacterium]